MNYENMGINFLKFKYLNLNPAKRRKHRRIFFMKLFLKQTHPKEKPLILSC